MFLLPLPDLPRGFRPYVAVQLEDQAVVFKQGNKDPRAHHAQLRMPPSHQRFRAAQFRFLSPHIKLRLEEHLKLLFPQRSLEILDQLLLHQLRLVHGVVVDPDGFRKVPLHRVRRDLRPVKPPLHVQFLVHPGVYAHPDPDPVFPLSVSAARHRDGDLFQERRIILPARAVDEERIRLAPAGNPACLLHIFQGLLSDLPQQFVPGFSPVPFVDHVEMIHVQENRVRRVIPVPRVQLHRVPAEEVLVVQSRQPVPLRPVQDIPVLAQFDGPPHPGQDHLLPGIGFGNKVNRPQRQAFHFRVAVRRHDDHRDPGIPAVVPDFPQHFQPVFIRQVQVQQHQVQRLILLMQDLQCFLSCQRRQHLIGIRQHHLQDFLVDHLIIDQQDSSLLHGRTKRGLFFRHTSAS